MRQVHGLVGKGMPTGVGLDVPVLPPEPPELPVLVGELLEPPLPELVPLPEPLPELTVLPPPLPELVPPPTVVPLLTELPLPELPLLLELPLLELPLLELPLLLEPPLPELLVVSLPELLVVLWLGTLVPVLFAPEVPLPDPELTRVLPSVEEPLRALVTLLVLDPGAPVDDVAVPVALRPDDNDGFAADVDEADVDVFGPETGLSEPDDPEELTAWLRRFPFAAVRRRVLQCGAAATAARVGKVTGTPVKAPPTAAPTTNTTTAPPTAMPHRVYRAPRVTVGS